MTPYRTIGLAPITSDGVLLMRQWIYWKWNLFPPVRGNNKHGRYVKKIYPAFNLIFMIFSNLKPLMQTSPVHGYVCLSELFQLHRNQGKQYAPCRACLLLLCVVSFP